MSEIVPKSILVATDLSGSADRVVASAGWLAHVFGAELRVLHAFEMSDQRYAPDGPVTPSFPARLGEAVRLLDAQVRRANIHPDVRVSRQVVIRSPAKAILELAATGFDLVVLGAHREEGFGFPLGSTTKLVIAQSPIPTLIVGPRAELPLRRVAVAHDLSQQGRRALEGALRWAGMALPGKLNGAPGRARPGHLDVVHVVRSHSHATRESRHRRALLEQEIGSALPEAPGAEALRIRPVVLAGDPEQRLSAFASSHSADLIVAGTNGGGALPKAALGGVASGLSHKALRFVLLIPPAAPPSVEGYRSRGSLPAPLPR